MDKLTIAQSFVSEAISMAKDLTPEPIMTTEDSAVACGLATQDLFECVQGQMHDPMSVCTEQERAEQIACNFSGNNSTVESVGRAAVQYAGYTGKETAMTDMANHTPYEDDLDTCEPISYFDEVRLDVINNVYFEILVMAQEGLANGGDVDGICEEIENAERQLIKKFSVNRKWLSCLLNQETGLHINADQCANKETDHSYVGMIQEDGTVTRIPDGMVFVTGPSTDNYDDGSMDDVPF